jgi:hypothetical protein
VSKPKLIQEQGKCPRCGSDDLDYGCQKIMGESLGYDFSCNNCGTEGVEWYDLVYSETSTTDVI